MAKYLEPRDDWFIRMNEVERRLRILESKPRVSDPHVLHAQNDADLTVGGGSDTTSGPSIDFDITFGKALISWGANIWGLANNDNGILVPSISLVSVRIRQLPDFAAPDYMLESATLRFEITQVGTGDLVELELRTNVSRTFSLTPESSSVGSLPPGRYRARLEYYNQGSSDTVFSNRWLSIYPQ